MIPEVRCEKCGRVYDVCDHRQRLAHQHQSKKGGTHREEPWWEDWKEENQSEFSKGLAGEL